MSDKKDSDERPHPQDETPVSEVAPLQLGVIEESAEDVEEFDGVIKVVSEENNGGDEGEDVWMVNSGSQPQLQQASEHTLGEQGSSVCYHFFDIFHVISYHWLWVSSCKLRQSESRGYRIGMSNFYS